MKKSYLWLALGCFSIGILTASLCAVDGETGLSAGGVSAPVGVSLITLSSNDYTFFRLPYSSFFGKDFLSEWAEQFPRHDPPFRISFGEMEGELRDGFWVDSSGMGLDSPSIWDEVCIKNPLNESMGLFVSGIARTDENPIWETLTDSGLAITDIEVFRDSNRLTISVMDPRVETFSILYKDRGDSVWKIAETGIQTEGRSSFFWIDSGNTEITHWKGFRLNPAWVSEREYVLVVSDDWADADKDGLSDGIEWLVYGSDPLNADSDGDGLKDGADLSLDPRLLTYYPMDEKGGGTLYDYSGNERHATLPHEGIWSSEGLTFNGLDQYALCPYAALSGTVDFTISCQIKSISASNQIIFQQRDETADGYNGVWILSLKNTGRAQLILYSDAAGQTTLIGKTIVNDGQWHQITAVRHGKTCSLFIDGKLDGSETGTIVSLNSGRRVVIGRSEREQNQYFEGSLRDFSIRAAALSDVMIATLFAKGTNRLSPTDPDFDHDGILDGSDGYNFESDRDHDGLLDGDELKYGSDPLKSDTDSDGFSDADEVQKYGTHPADAASNPTVLPSGWQFVKIGNPQTTQTPLVYKDRVEMGGSATDMWYGSDECQWLNFPTDGDFDIACKVLTISGNVGPASRAGLMVRDGLSPHAGNVFLCLTGNGIQFQARDRGGLKYTWTVGSAPHPAANAFLRLTRTGNIFKAYTSANGINWSEIGSCEAFLRHDSALGYAICSANNNAVLKAEFQRLEEIRPFMGPIICVDSGRGELWGSHIGKMVWSRGKDSVLKTYDGAFSVSPNERITAQLSRDGFKEVRRSRLFPEGLTPGIPAVFYPGKTVENPTAVQQVKILRQFDATLTKSAIFNAPQTENYSFVSEGKIDIPFDGEYTFYLTADDSAGVKIDGKTLLSATAGMGECSVKVTLSQGLHDFRFDFSQFGGSQCCLLEWSSAELPRQFIGLPYLFSQDSDHDGIADVYERAETGSLEVLDAQSDSDSDGRTDADELIYFCSDPKESDPKPLMALHSVPADLTNGLFARYYSWVDYWVAGIESYGNRFVYATDTFRNMEFPRNANSSHTPDKRALFSSVYEGYLYVPERGTYEFFITSNDGAILSLNGVAVLIYDGPHDYLTRSSRIALEPGYHSFSISYNQQGGEGGVVAQWSGPQIPRQVISEGFLFHSISQAAKADLEKDSDGDGLSDLKEIEYGSDPNRGDTDGDGIPDGDEIRLKTNPLSRDSDGDGMSDYDECFLIYSDPNRVDFDGSVETLSTLYGVDYLGDVVGWTREDSSAVCLDRAGSVSYRTPELAAGSYRVKIRTRQGYPGETFNRFTLSLWVDGIPSGISVCDVNGIASFWLPVLKNGVHTLRLSWQNMTPMRTLIVDTLSIDALGGPDNDQNGVPDWLDSRLKNASMMSVSATSYTSPVCVEGITDVESQSIEFEGFEGTDTPHARTTFGRNWYANIPLKPEEVTDFSAHFPKTGMTERGMCEWLTFNILDSDSRLSIRSGDALKLNSRCDTAADAWGEVFLNGVSHRVTMDSPLIARFGQAGVYNLKTIHHSDSVSSQTGELKVTVFSGKFAGSPTVLTRHTRDWANPNLERNLNVQSAPNLALTSISSSSGSIYRMVAPEAGRYPLIARLYANGPITDAASVTAVSTSWESLSTGEVIYEYPDGSTLYEGRIKMSDFPPGFRISIGTWIPGILLENGSTEMFFTADDLDENGVLTYRLLRLPGATSGNCHFLRFYDGDQILYSGF